MHRYQQRIVGIGDIKGDVNKNIVRVSDALNWSFMGLYILMLSTTVWVFY